MTNVYNIVSNKTHYRMPLLVYDIFRTLVLCDNIDVSVKKSALNWYLCYIAINVKMNREMAY